MGIHIGTFEELRRGGKGDGLSGLLSEVARCGDFLTSGKGWPEGVNELLGVLGKATGVSRVWIFQTLEVTETHITQNYAFEWVAEPWFKQIGMPIFSMFTKPIDEPEYSQLIGSRKRGEWQKVLPETMEEGWFRDSLLSQKIKSMLTIPIMVDNEWWGTLGFDDCERTYDWRDEEVATLRIATYLIGNAILQNRLEARRKQFDILKLITDSNTWSFDFKTGNLWCSQEISHSGTKSTNSINLTMHAALRLAHPKDRRALFRDITKHLRSGEKVFRRDVRLKDESGVVRWMELIGSLSVNEDGSPSQLAGIAVDIEDRKQEEARLLEEASTDPLTGVMNRREFDRILKESVARTTVVGVPFALLLLDIDYFKGLNDKYGHSVGDEILKYFTEICRENLRSQDVIARIGGDEFAILMPGVREDTAQSVGERIRRCVVSKPYTSSAVRVFMTTSIGLTVFEGGIATPEDLSRQADAALYAAKEGGRNKIVLHRETSPL